MHGAVDFLFQVMMHQLRVPSSECEIASQSDPFVTHRVGSCASNQPKRFLKHKEIPKISSSACRNKRIPFFSTWATIRMPIFRPLVKAKPSHDFVEIGVVSAAKQIAACISVRINCAKQHMTATWCLSWALLCIQKICVHVSNTSAGNAF